MIIVNNNNDGTCTVTYTPVPADVGSAVSITVYATDAFYEFVDVVPSAFTELAHWQLEGYALITPIITEKKFSIEEIR